MNIMFKDLELVMNDHAIPVQVNNQTLAVAQYLPIGDKHELIDTVVNAVIENGICDYVKLHALFRLYVVCLYTNIELDEDDMERTFELYDLLESNGTINAVFEVMNKTELEDIQKMLYDTLYATLDYNKSFAGTLAALMHDLPLVVGQLKTMSQDLDIDKFKQVFNIANATGANI